MTTAERIIKKGYEIVNLSREENELILNYRLNKIDVQLNLLAQPYKDYSNKVKSTLIEIAFYITVEKLIEERSLFLALTIGHFEESQTLIDKLL